MDTIVKDNGMIFRWILVRMLFEMKKNVILYGIRNQSTKLAQKLKNKVNYFRWKIDSMMNSVGSFAMVQLK